MEGGLELSVILDHVDDEVGLLFFEETAHVHRDLVPGAFHGLHRRPTHHEKIILDLVQLAEEEVPFFLG